MDTVEVSKEAKFQERDLITMRQWCEENTWFDDGFLSSLESFFCKHKYLTAKQHAALINMMERHNVD